MEADRDLAWRLQLEEFFNSDQIELLNLSGHQRPERMAEMAEFLQNVFELDSGVGILTEQVEAPPSDLQQEVEQKRSVAEKATNQITDDLKNISMETPPMRSAQDNGAGQSKSRSSNKIGDASACPGLTKNQQGNQPQARIQGSTCSSSATEADVESQKREGSGGAGGSCYIEPHDGNEEAGDHSAAARSGRSQLHTGKDGVGSSCPRDTVYLSQTPGGADSSCHTERHQERQTEARDGGAGSSCPTARRVETQQGGPNEDAGSASPENKSEECLSQARSPAGDRQRNVDASRTDDSHNAFGLEEMAQRLQGCTAKMGPEDMRALQEAIDEENRMYMDLLRGDARAMRFFNRADPDRANRIRASQARVMYSAGLLHHPSGQPMYCGSEQPLAQKSSRAPGGGSGSTNISGEWQPEAAKREPTQPRDEAATETPDSDTDSLPEIPQRPNTPLNVVDSRHISRMNRIRRQRQEQARETASAFVCVSQPDTGGELPGTGTPLTKVTIHTKTQRDADRRPGLSPGTVKPKERFEPQIDSEPHREARPEPQIPIEPHRKARPEPHIANEPFREARPEPQMGSFNAQGSNTPEQNVNNQGLEPGTSSRSVQADRPPLIENEVNNEGERSRMVAREIIREFNRAFAPLFSMTPSYPIPPFDATSSDQTSQPDTREARSPPTIPRMNPDELRFLTTLHEFFRYVDNPRASALLSRFSESELVILRFRLFARRAELQATRAARELNSVELDLISRSFSLMAGSLSTLGQLRAARNTQSPWELATSGSQGATNVQQGSKQEHETYDFLDNETSITNLIVLLERQIVDIRTRQSGSLAETFQPSNPGSSREAQQVWQYQNSEAESTERRRRMLEEIGQPGQDMGAFMRFFLRRYVFQPSGLTPSQLSSLPIEPHNEATGQAGSSSSFQCSICLCEYQAGDEVRILPCGHRFHKECVDEWLQRTATCPVCRSRIRPSQH